MDSATKRTRALGPICWLALAGSLLAAGCEKGDGVAELADEHDVDLSPALGRVVQAWQAADLEISELRAVDQDDEAAADLGGACVAGNVAQIPVVVCEYASAEEAEAAEGRGLSLVGEATGLSLARGELVLVAADRHESDPDGRRLNEIANAFRALD